MRLRRRDKMSHSTTIVIFGASGDLTRRKLIPALYSLYRKNRLSGDFNVVGYSRTQMKDAEFRARVQVSDDQGGECDIPESGQWAELSRRLYYHAGSYTDPGDFKRLDERLSKIEKGDSNRLYYLAIAPRFFTEIVGHLAKNAMTREKNGWRRVVIEKPFGKDLSSALELNDTLHRDLHENQIYRIDHYLGKETVQNVMIFRFANAIFEPIWNRNFIDHVQITVAETVDVGHRAGYYDQSGVLRDMFQNHMLQMLALVGMEPPASFDADAIRNEKVKLLSALRTVQPEKVAQESVRGQYEGYRAAPDIPPDSETPTYAAVRLYIDNWRWKGVPFYLRSGKALQKKASEIIIQFKEPPHIMFPLPEKFSITANQLALRVQPDEGIHLRFEAKVPDTAADMRSVNMDFRYAESFGTCAIPEAYERLLYDALNGDASLFTRSDGIEKQWRFIDPIIRGWNSKHAPSLATYRRGSWGPVESDKFLAKDGRKWLQSSDAT
jgi:glucose-6-phosphate 1-dehydrogenase